MKRRFITSLKCLLAGVMFLSSIVVANAAITVTLTSPQTTYIAGQNNTFTFNVGLTYSGAEYVDRYMFTFPAGVTVVSGTPASGIGTCASNAGIQSICSPSISWSKAGVPCSGAFAPTACGAYNAANSVFTVTVAVPAGFTGPLSVNLNSIGDGFLLAAGSVDNDAVSFAQFLPPVPCALVCPANTTVNLDPGACNQIVNYNVSTTGDCFVGGTVNGFSGTFAPSAINYYQHGNGIFFNPPTPYTNGPGVTFNGANTTLQLVSTNLFNAGAPSFWFFNGVEWTNTTASAQTVTFNWSYSTLDGAFWDFPLYLLGSAANNFSNNNFGNQSGNWTVFPGYNVNGAAVQNGTASIVVAPGQRLALSAFTRDGGGGEATINITNFAFNSVVPAVAVQTSGIPSGGTFPIGTTTNCFSITANNPLGVPTTTSCCFNVVVNEFPNPVLQLNCNDEIHISLDNDCEACIGADDVLEGGPYGCYDDYTVELDKTLPFGNGPWVPACVGPADVGKTYYVRVRDLSQNPVNSCWGTVKIEDKVAPTLLCHDITLPCNADPNAPENAQPYPAVTGPQSINFTPNAEIGEAGAPVPDVQVYNFNYGYLPVGTPVLDVNMRIKLTGHTFLPDLNMVVTAPNGLTADVFTLTGCTGAEWPIDLIFDDEGVGNLQFCIDLNANGGRLQSVVAPGVSSPTVLSAFDGLDASGIWKVTLTDGFAGDDGLVEIVGLEITVSVPAVVPSDGCGPITLTYIDQNVVGNCASGIGRSIIRKYTATDQSGNTSTCTQRINFEISTLADVVLPPDYDGIDAPMFNCIDNAYPTPEWIEGQGLQGSPYVFGSPDGCNIDFAYEDLVIDVCDGTYKIRREWTVLDWCVGDGFVYNQIIKVVDNEGPTFACPANTTVSIDPFSCCAFVNLPDAIIEDNCSRINNVSGMVVTFDQYTGEQSGMFTFGGSVSNFPGNNLWDLDTLGAFGFTPCLPIGTHTVTYIAEDDCGNTSSCTFRLTVRDYIPPISVCDETTTVGIGVDDPFDCYGPAGYQNLPSALGACDFAGVTWVKARDFGDGSYDYCGNVHYTVRRMAPYSDCIQGLNATNGFLPCDDPFTDFPSEFERAISEYDSIKFYCCEVGTIQTIVLTIYQVDINGNFTVGPDGSPISNQCMIQVEVQDKLRPYCLPPANVTVACEQFDPSLWLYGKASVYDNCCLDQTKEYQGQCGLTHTASYTQFDTVCNKGTIIRTFRAFDCHGQTSQCTQRVVVNYNQDYFVKFPNDVIVTVCDGTGNYGEPTYFGEDCELLGATYQDAIFTVVPDACFKIERTWKIINWCTYNSNLPCINVPNPNPAGISNAPANLPGPTVSRCGTLAPWAPTVVKINPTDAVATNFCTFWDANANCYIYKQIIKIIDGVAPTVVGGCPASPVTICDITPNNNQLWNEMFWWDNANQSHDLCEAPADICITATDACSGSNINIEYQLFLDLDGDGVMETIINSINTGIAGLGWNAVPFGNANGGAGVIRQFDERLVNFNQKYGFAIQETVSGVNKTACVRFNTQQSQNTFVPAELPYGTHKIKWFITDGCGNEAICEYTIIVKDCKAPTVVCYHGLSVNIMPGGMIAMWDTDFLQYTEDNCTQTPFLKTAIRKCGQGTGFPVDANGQPIKSVIFTCDELGEQCVEIWSIDLAGNADYCQTYIDVQDNNGNCSNNTVNVSGGLKTESTDGIEEAVVTVAGNGSFTFSDASDNAGLFSVMNQVPVNSNFTITPAKDDNPLNGVTTYDLVLISKHILGIEPLGSSYKMIAADANKSNSITTFDIVELRKLILGIYQELPNNTSWRFVDKAHLFANPSNPWTSTIPENISVAQAAAHVTGADFVGVKIGDVNGTAVANTLLSSEDRTAGTLLFDVNDRDVKAGEEFEVAFKAADKTQGYQMTLNLKGLEVSEIVGGDNVTANNFGVFADAMTVSVDGSDAFAVKFRATKSGKLSEMMAVSSRITKAEAYSMVDGRMEVALRFDGKTIAGVGFELYQNQPNPFVNKTFVGFHLPEATAATLTVYDETGRMVFTQKGDFAKGYNTISLDRALLNTTGVLYYSLETATDAATKKMIQAK